MSLDIFLKNEAETRRFGADLALLLQKGDFVALRGDLGTGKSTLARALIRSLVQDMALEVPSPTFSLMQHYESRCFTITHADLYRLHDGQEIEELGLMEMLAQGIVLVEWPERAADLLPTPSIDIFIDYARDGRQLVIETDLKTQEQLERCLEIRRFLTKHDHAETQRYYLAGDASSRRYETVISADNQQQWVLMDAARFHPREEPSDKAANYAQMVHLAQDVRQFVGLARLLKDNGFAAPHIIASDLERHLLLLEHLGSEGIIDAHGYPIRDRYLSAAELLADIHAFEWPHRQVWPDLVLNIPAYDPPTLYREVSLLLDWYVPYYVGRQVSDTMRQQYKEIWQKLIHLLQQAEQGLCLRDYHSPNLIWRDEKTGHDRLGLIDFQDALIGPVAYDVASLAQDARVTIEPELERAIINPRRKHHDGTFDEIGLRDIYAIAGGQRVMKILGLFVRLDRRDGKPDYLHHLPRLRDYLARNLSHPDLHALRDFLDVYAIS